MIETLSIVGTRLHDAGALDDRLLKRLQRRRQIRRARSRKTAGIARNR